MKTQQADSSNEVENLRVRIRSEMRIAPAPRHASGQTPEVHAPRTELNPPMPITGIRDHFAKKPTPNPGAEAQRQTSKAQSTEHAAPRRHCFTLAFTEYVGNLRASSVQTATPLGYHSSDSPSANMLFRRNSRFGVCW